MRRIVFLCTLIFLLGFVGVGAGAENISQLSDDVSQIEKSNITTNAGSLGYGDTVRSELDENDRYNEDLNGYHENYTFYGQDGDEISVQMRPDGGPLSTDHAAKVTIYDPRGNIVEESYSDAGYATPDGEDRSPTIELDQDGTYTIVATTADAPAESNSDDAYSSYEASLTDTFDYELRLHSGKGEPTSIEYGSTVEGALTTESDYHDELNGYYDTYTFDAVAGDEISVQMRPDGGPLSTAHAAKVTIYDPRGNIVEESYSDAGYATPDGERLSPSRFSSTIELDQDGTYTIVATTADAPAEPNSDDAYSSYEVSQTDTFDYELRLNSDKGEPTPIEYGSTVKAALTNESDYHDELNGYYDTYTFDAESGDEISVQMRPDGGPLSTAHAAKVTIYDPRGNIVEESYSDAGYATPDGEQLSPSHISSTIELDQEGTYTIVATTADAPAEPNSDDAYSSYEASQTDTFDYELRLNGDKGEPTPIEYGSTVEAALTNESDYHDELNGYYDVYSFDAVAGDEISVQMRPDGGPLSTDHAAKVTIYDPRGNIVEESYSDAGYAILDGESTSPTIELDQTGNYTIVAATAEAPNEPNQDDAYSSYEASQTDTFDYELRLYEGIGDGQQISLGTTLTTEITQSDNYLDELSGYYDIYSFNATSGQRVSAEVRVNDPGADTPEVRLFAPDRTEVFTSRDDGGMAQLERYQIDQSGEFDLVVTTREEGYDDATAARTATPRYQLRFYEDVGNRTLLEYGDTVTDRLSPQDNYLDDLAGYYDAYTLSASEGDAVTANVSVDDTENDAAQVMLLAPDGSTAASTRTDAGGATLSDYSVSQTGVYTVVVTSEPDASVYDSTKEGKSDGFRYQLSVDGPANNPPIVTARSEPEKAAVGEFVTLSATASDPNGDSLSYEWEQIIGAFPDPEPTLQQSDTATPTFTAPSVEASTRLDFEVTVSDGDGGTVTKETAVTVDPSLSPPPEPAEPTASFTVSPTAPSTGAAVTFDASASTDPEGSIETYRWDFDGDDSYESTGETVTHEFTTTGDTPVTLEVVSTSGASNTTTQTVAVSANEPPVPAVSARPERPDTGASVTFSGANSTDPDGTIQSYRWNITGEETMSGETIMHTFESTGERQVSLTVTDNAGATQTATTNVTVSPSTAPTVSLTPTETRASVDSTTTFDITLSGASAGVSAYDLNVSVGNTSVATIATGTVSSQFSPTVPGGQIASDGSAARLVAESGALSETGSVTLGNISLSSVAPGTTEVNITVESVSGASGVAYESPAITDATITIDGSAGDPSPVVGSATPTDVDADGQYEDINGDGTFDIVDVSAFFNHFTDDTVQNQTPEAFDFNDDGSVNIVDVNRLFEAVA